jgi:hypothetical protein
VNSNLYEKILFVGLAPAVLDMSESKNVELKFEDPKQKIVVSRLVSETRKLNSLVESDSTFEVISECVRRRTKLIREFQILFGFKWPF